MRNQLRRPKEGVTTVSSLMAKVRRNGPPRPPEGPAIQPVAFELTPLQYLIEVFNDPHADARRRDRAAVAAAPYVHARPAPAGKKAAAAKAAKRAGAGTDWAGDLMPQ